MDQRILIVVSDRPVAEMAPVAPMPPAEDVVREIRRQGERLLADASGQANRVGVRNRTSLHENVEAVNCITSTAHNERCNLIVVGAEQRNAVMRIITGSIVPGLITRAPVPVLVCHEPSEATDPSA